MADQKLPTNHQFLTAKGHLAWAADRALLVHYAANDGQAKMFKVDCIAEVKEAATALGYELVQRVTPAARDGGRMEVPEGYDAE